MVHGTPDSPTHFLGNGAARIDSVNCLAWYWSEYTKRMVFQRIVVLLILRIAVRTDVLLFRAPQKLRGGMFF